MNSPKLFKFQAPAKLNLGLKIVGKNKAGYHLLKSVFCLIDLFDDLEIEVVTKDEICLINHTQEWAATDDLVYKSAMLLKEITKTKLGAQIQVTKKIPIGSGLGGGSSDAATTLIALNYLWKTGLSLDQLIEIATPLGADIPFFILGQNAYVEGIGEILTPIDLPNYHFVVIKPSVGCVTSEIFTNFTLSTSINPSKINAETLLNNLENDLQAVATKLNPSLKDLENQLKQFGHPVMTGSGSAFFLKYSNLAEAIKVADHLKILYNCYLVKKLDFSPMRDFFRGVAKW